MANGEEPGVREGMGLSEESISAELSAKHAALCGDACTCPLQTTFEGWLKQAVPVVLTPKK